MALKAMAADNVEALDAAGPAEEVGPLDALEKQRRRCYASDRRSPNGNVACAGVARSAGMTSSWAPWRPASHLRRSMLWQQDCCVAELACKLSQI